MKLPQFQESSRPGIAPGMKRETRCVCLCERCVTSATSAR